MEGEITLFKCKSPYFETLKNNCKLISSFIQDSQSVGWVSFSYSDNNDGWHVIFHSNYKFCLSQKIKIKDWETVWQITYNPFKWMYSYYFWYPGLSVKMITELSLQAIDCYSCNIGDHYNCIERTSGSSSHWSYQILWVSIIIIIIIKFWQLSQLFSLYTLINSTQFLFTQ